MRRASAWFAVVLACGLLVAGPALAAGRRSISLSASKFGFAAEPGQKGTGSVEVINEGDEPVSVRVYAANQVIAADGSATYVVPTIDANRLSSPASWVTFKLPPNAKSLGNIPYVDVAPRASVPVTFTVSVPDGATPGDRQAVLFFEMFEPESANASANARVSARLGARISTRVKGEIVEDVRVQPFSMPQAVVGSEVPFRFVIRNAGNIDERMRTRIAVLDRSENERISSEITSDMPVYAGASLERKGTFELPSPAIGPQHVRLVAEYVGDSGVAKAVEEDRTVWAFPLWLLVAAGAILLAILVAFVWGASRRAAERRHRARRRMEQLAE